MPVPWHCCTCCSAFPLGLKAPVSRDRFVLLGLFFAAAQFPVLWIFPWERSETLPTAAYLAAIVLLIVRRSRMPFVLVCLLTLLLGLFQALVRADVPVLAGVAILLAAAIAIPFPRLAAHVAILGLLCARREQGYNFTWPASPTRLPRTRQICPRSSYSPT